MRCTSASHFASGEHAVVEPSGGRAYNVLPGSAGDFSGFCGGRVLEPGWAEELATWDVSTFDAAALNSAGNAGKPVQVVVQYGTDAAAVERGFWFDQVVLTNAEFEIPDAQSDVCDLPPACFEFVTISNETFSDTATREACHVLTGWITLSL